MSWIILFYYRSMFLWDDFTWDKTLAKASYSMYKSIRNWFCGLEKVTCKAFSEYLNIINYKVQWKTVLQIRSVDAIVKFTLTSWRSLLLRDSRKWVCFFFFSNPNRFYIPYIIVIYISYGIAMWSGERDYRPGLYILWYNVGLASLNNLAMMLINLTHYGLFYVGAVMLFML